MKLPDVGTGLVLLLAAFDFEVDKDVKGIDVEDDVLLFSRCVTVANVVDSGVDAESEDFECSFV